MPKIINVFQFETPKGLLYTTASDHNNPELPCPLYTGKLIAKFKCHIKDSVTLKADGLVKYFSKRQLGINA